MHMQIGRLILFVLLVWSCTQHGPRTVGIQPYGDFERALTDTVAHTLRRLTGVKVYVLDRKPIPEKAFINLKAPRYRADAILKILEQEKPDSLNHIMALTTFDISTTKTDTFGNVKEPKSKYADWGIFGLGQKPGAACILSTFRLKNATHAKFIDRVKKVSVHELGHAQGLDHCTSPYCVMKDAAESIHTIDQVRLEFCENCRRKIQ